MKNNYLIRKGIGFFVCLLILVFILVINDLRTDKDRDPNQTLGSPEDAKNTVNKINDGLTMLDVLKVAKLSLNQMEIGLSDYTARFVKQELDANAEMPKESEMFIKVQTRFREDRTEAPRRIYLRFNKPDSLDGREVIWGEDLYSGKMAVHEVGLILGLKTLWLDPDGFIAMQGQRHPISEIGIVKLTEQLIEQGEKDLSNQQMRITRDLEHSFDGVRVHLITIQRLNSGESKDDFYQAEIIFDPLRQLILAFRSFSAPESEDKTPALIESYAYYDLKTNVGLSDEDFNTANSKYSFPDF
ncbi:DUF1571 domain-containing protein [Rubripirellula sp.]|nr:DUF1571 domain-containing protein [Rubripirellula sp.]